MRQVRDQHWLADTVQHRPRKIGNLIYNRFEQFPTHVCGRLKFLVGARTRGAQQIAAIGHFQIKTNWRTVRDLCALALYRFVIAARIYGQFNERVIAGRDHCDRPVSAVRSNLLSGRTRSSSEDNFQIELTSRPTSEFENPSGFRQSARVLQWKLPRLVHCRIARRTARLPENTKGSWATTAAGPAATAYWCPSDWSRSFGPDGGQPKGP